MPHVRVRCNAKHGSSIAYPHEQHTANFNRHTLSSAEKKSYIDAELCLMEIKASNGMPAARTRFDELQENHQIQANEVHGVVCF